MLGPDIPTHVPTDPHHRPDVFDIVLGRKIRWPMYVEVVFGMDTQHLSILVTVGTGTSNSPPATSRQHRSVFRRYDIKARVEVIAEYLAEQFISNPPATSPSSKEHYAQIEKRVRKFMNTLPPARPGDLFITATALHKIVIHLPKKKTPELDGKIITIPKTGKDPRKPENIRPIILLSRVAKPFERALLIKQCLFLFPQQEQYGFRSSHSTTLQLIRVLHHLASERNCERYTVVTLHCRLHSQELSPVFSNNAVSALLSTTCYPPHVRYEQEFHRAAAYLLNYMRYTPTIYRRCRVTPSQRLIPALPALPQYCI
ncbi:hypothetical protein EVAR_18822_1 [Eumeta japonica]|uniref:RNA-directed DNA polymerase from transposon X-element n=1 Tax=Eumeta variegata TaxID=151549 RepID=A0A4C1ULM7_EUMVA|nr:hypothetical protein EVAR_18822_1 [Eumeta japonica]